MKFIQCLVIVLGFGCLSETQIRSPSNTADKDPASDKTTETKSSGNPDQAISDTPVCAGLSEDDCKAISGCNALSGTDLSTGDLRYMGCLENNSKSGLFCGESIECFKENNSSTRVRRGDNCAPKGWISDICPVEDF